VGGSGSGQNVAQAFEKILADGNCNMLQRDEFLNSTFQSMLRRRGIKFYTSENEHLKATVVERFNRTLKTKIFRYFTHVNTRRYLNVLDDLLNSYNNTHHRSIGMAPSEVNADNETVVRARLYPLKPKTYQWKYAVGDRVRIGMQRKPVRKGYLGESSEEIFEISTRLPTVPVTYELRDLLGESIKIRFYEPEIQRVLKSEDECFVVDGLLKTRERDGKIPYLVSWKGYPSNFDTWVDELATI